MSPVYIRPASYAATDTDAHSPVVSGLGLKTSRTNDPSSTLWNV